MHLATEQSVKAFLQEKHINSMIWPENSSNLNPIENLWWKLKNMVHDRAPSCKADLSTAIRESWNRLDEEYSLMFEKHERLDIFR